ncbi:MAG: hypothetical protein Q9164_005061 [Protoblastenia rupestris]
MLLRVLLWTLVTTAHAIPSINLPINAQVPPVARANQPFRFVFSESTFTSTTGNISYALSKSPAWLKLEGSGRTLVGFPTIGDTGAITVDLTASDDTGTVTMSVTLVVSTDPGPGLGLPLEDQLSAYGASSSPNSIMLAPSTPLALSLSPDTFTNTNSETVYYALCANHTPLPSWIQFDPKKLAFSGRAPQSISLAGVSQIFDIELTASNVVGFADAIVMFKIVIESHLLAFSNHLQIINVTAGSLVDVPVLQQNLLLNGQRLNKSAITHVSATTPPWLMLDSTTLVLSGMPPENATDQNFTITVTDGDGDSASTMVILQTSNRSSNALLKSIGVTNATAGTDFLYSLNSTLNAPRASLSVDLGMALDWLEYDKDARIIKGRPPNDLNPQHVVVNITAVQDGESQSELLVIAVQNAHQATQTAMETASHSATLGSQESSRKTAAASGSQAHVQRNWIAAAVILPLATCLGAVVLFAYCWKRRRRTEKRAYIDQSPSSPKQHISQPIVHEKTQQAIEGAAMSGGLLGKKASSRISMPPKLPWTWPDGSNKRDSQIRLSKTSFGERSQRPDSWQKFTANFANVTHSKFRTTSDFNRIPEEMTPRKTDNVKDMGQNALRDTVDKNDTTTAITPLKKHAKQLRESSTMSLGSSGQLYSQIMGGRRNPGRGHGSMLFSNMCEDPPRGRRSMGPPLFGIVQKSWKNMKESQSTSEWTDTTGDSSSQEHDHRIRNYRTRQPTIRPVWPSQTLGEQTSRSTTNPAPPLYVPKSARLRRSENPFLSGGSIYSRDFSRRGTFLDAPPWRNPRHSISPRRNRSEAIDHDLTSEGQKMGRSYSRSSSVHPHLPSSPSRPSKPPEHRLSRFDYSYAPRVIGVFPPIPHSDDKDSIMSIDPRYESPVPSETQSLYNYNLDMDAFRELDNIPSPERQRYLNPLPPSSLDTEDARPGLSAAFLASRRESGPLQKLSHMVPRLEDDSIGGDERTIRSDDEASVNVKGSPRGKRLDQQIGLRQGDPANTSMRGEIKRSGSSSFL